MKLGKTKQEKKQLVGMSECAFENRSELSLLHLSYFSFHDPYIGESM